MSDGRRSRVAARVHLACGRVAGGASAIAEAHRFGVPEGPHDALWTAAYHADVVKIYAESLPASYQRDIALLFSDSAEAMAGYDIPAVLAEDWLIVTGYLRHASEAVMAWLDSEPAQSLPETDDGLAIDDRTPMVIRFDRLAAQASHEGARRLERAALAAQRHVGAPSALVLGDEQRRLLRGVASGTAIVDLAEQLGYSRRSMYRELSKLWQALGVPDRTQGLRKAAAEGLLD